MKKCLFVLGTLMMVHPFLYSQFVVDGLRLENNLLSPPMGFAPVKGVAVPFPPWTYFDFFVTNNAIFYFEQSKPRPFIITKKDLVLNENKYYTFELEGTFASMANEKAKYVFIAGGDIIIYDHLPGFGIMFPARTSTFPPVPIKDTDIPFMNIFWFWEDGIESISASSALRERRGKEEIVYDESQLRETFFGMMDGFCYFNSFKRAWAEGVQGDGIGESLLVNFTSETDHVMILNGYVNLRNMDLYTANNRVKKARIVSEDPFFSIEHDFDDVVKFTQVDFPEKTRQIKFIIEDVYKGSKYQDTCITSVFLKQQAHYKTHKYFRPFVRDMPEYKQRVDKMILMLKENGYSFLHTGE
ncbi:MAG: hypothetical protein LBL44_13265 [Treponema sp.]|jgi:hypothetical protein|nr:hypothetical protein [Treponema sp.]